MSLGLARPHGLSSRDDRLKDLLVQLRAHGQRVQGLGFIEKHECVIPLRKGRRDVVAQAFARKLIARWPRGSRNEGDRLPPCASSSAPRPTAGLSESSHDSSRCGDVHVLSGSVQGSPVAPDAAANASVSAASNSSVSSR